MLPLRAAWTMIAAHARNGEPADDARRAARNKGEAGRATDGARARIVAALFGLPWLFWPDWRMGVAACVALVLVRAWAATS